MLGRVVRVGWGVGWGSAGAVLHSCRGLPCRSKQQAGVIYKLLRCTACCCCAAAAADVAAVLLHVLLPLLLLLLPLLVLHVLLLLCCGCCCGCRRLLLHVLPLDHMLPPPLRG